MLRILLVEDNPADVQMLRTALGKSGMPVEIIHVRDGVQAVEYLSNQQSLARFCDVVLLDLNLPRLTGFEVLEHIRGCDELKSLPVVVMSGSTNTDEIDRCYQAGANSYISKAIHLEEILATAAWFVAYWSRCVKLPSRRLPGRAGKSQLAAVNTK